MVDAFSVPSGVLDGDFEPFMPEPSEHARGARLLDVRASRAANLNVADCVAHGVAKTASATLLFKGNDFSRSDAKPTPEA
jgi:uncharacterized protein with PIN domain